MSSSQLRRPVQLPAPDSGPSDIGPVPPPRPGHPWKHGEMGAAAQPFCNGWLAQALCPRSPEFVKPRQNGQAKAIQEIKPLCPAGNLTPRPATPAIEEQKSGECHLRKRSSSSGQYFNLTRRSIRCLPTFQTATLLCPPPAHRGKHSLYHTAPSTRYAASALNNGTGFLQPITAHCY